MYDERKQRRRGGMRWKIEIQKPSQVQSPSGDDAVNYVSLGTAFAYVEDQSGEEDIRKGNFSGTQTTMFVINYREDLNQSMRILFRGEKFEIQRIELAGNFKNRTVITAVRLR